MRLSEWHSENHTTKRKMARLEGLEPPTYWFVASYYLCIVCKQTKNIENGALQLVHYLHILYSAISLYLI